MSYFLQPRTNAQLLDLRNSDGHPYFVSRSSAGIDWEVIPAQGREGIWQDVTGHFVRFHAPNGSIYTFANLMPSRFGVLSSAVWHLIRGYDVLMHPVPEDEQDRAQMRAELLALAQMDPFGLLTLMYLQRYRKALKITLVDLNNFVGQRYTTVVSQHDDKRHIVPHNFRTAGYGSSLTPTEVWELLYAITWEALCANPEESGIGTAPAEILRYSTKVQDVLSFHLEPKKPYIGIEIELEAKSDVSKSLAVAHKHIGKHAIFKGDGSINNGFEIVTRPDLWKNHRKAMQEFFKEIPQYMVARSNCGIHIHMTRSGLSFLQLAKILEFVNSANNREFIYHIADRRENYYCLPKNEINITNAGRNLNNGNTTFGDRYQAINLRNTATIEFRIFASTTNFSSFLKYMQFVVALREYTSPGAVSLSPKAQVNYTEFVKWLGSSANRKEFPELVAACAAFQPQQ